MSSENILNNIKEAMTQIDEEKVTNAVEEALSQGVDPLKAIEEGLSPGMVSIGDKFNRGECYLPELIKAADAFNAAMGILEPEIKKSGAQKTATGTVVTGTVKGDIHNIGKDILGMLMKTRGFEVVDLGIDVAASAFLTTAEERNADIIAMSSLLTTTMPGQQEVIDLLKERGVRDKYITMVGGGPVNKGWADEIGADGYADTAEQAVRLAEELILARK
jgi:corrinoid protein of di/trimethylamine methyltransferase